MRRGARWIVLTLLALAAVLVSLPSTRAMSDSGPADTTFAPVLNLIPAEDGTALYVEAGGVTRPGGTVFVNLGIGPGHDKGSWTMSYSQTLDLYASTVAGFTPGVSTAGEMHITTTLGLETAPVVFSRDFVRSDRPVQLDSPDGRLRLGLINPATLPADGYIAMVPSYAPPAPPPAGYRIVGDTYSVRASGSLLVTDRPMALSLGYTPEQLGSLDPHTLEVVVWDPAGRRWEPLGGVFLADGDNPRVASDTRRFGAYTLMSGPAWRDHFGDLEGLDPAMSSEVDLGVIAGDPALVPTTGQGVAVSRQITATEARRWGSLSYEAVVPPGARLAIDLLSADGRLLAEDLVSGADLTTITTEEHPALRLRARLTTAPDGARPGLVTWRLTWQGTADRQGLYLPVVAR